MADDMACQPGSPKVGTPLPRLAPVEVVPTARTPPSRASASEVDAAAATALRRVAALEIRAVINAKGKPTYEVCVFLQQTPPVARIPVPSALGTHVKPAGREAGPDPDLVATYPFAAFRWLREDVYDEARRGHTPGHGVERACTFCAGVVDAVLLDAAHVQPHRYDAWFRSAAQVSGRLEAFLQDLLARARGDAARPLGASRTRCAVQAQVQSRLARFLLLLLDDEHAAAA